MRLTIVNLLNSGRGKMGTKAFDNHPCTKAFRVEPAICGTCDAANAAYRNEDVRLQDEAACCFVVGTTARPNSLVVPAKSRDPYRGIFPCHSLLIISSNTSCRWLWAPAPAGATIERM